MPMHDWTRVSAGTFHDFHCTWIPEIKIRLNDGILPADYYAQVEQVAGGMTADILALRQEPDDDLPDIGETGGGTAVTEAPPQVRYTASLEMDHYAARRRQVAIKHSSDDRVVALIEVVSPGNKSGKRVWQAFLAKAVSTLAQGRHLLIADLFPPTPRDPNGVHGELWAELGDDSYVAPTDKPLTLAAYSAGLSNTAYVEPIAVGDSLKAMPLFLKPDIYVNVPLEESYMSAYRGVPRRWREVLEAKG